MPGSHVRPARPRDPEDPFDFTVAELRAAYLAGRLTPTAYVESLLDRIDTFEPELNAFITVTADLALEQAREAERRLAEGGEEAFRAAPLLGVPVTIKDNFDLAGVRTTAGSALRRDRRAAADAAVVARWRRAGAVILGKTNLHEFAWGATTENPHFGPARNPWDPRRSPGGSSGGAAAALAAGLGVLALGSDTGGSVRIPAALCGLVGIKPTNGALPADGLVPLAASLDCPGVLARTAADAAWGLAALAAGDGGGQAGAGTVASPVAAPAATPAATPVATPVAAPPGWAASLLAAAASPAGSLAGLRVGVPRDPFWHDLNDDHADRIEEALAWLRDRGAVVEEIGAPFLAEATVHQGVIARFEAFAALGEDWRRRPEGFGPDVAARLRAAAVTTRADYELALQGRARLVAEARAAFERHDLLALPTTRTTAPKIGSYLKEDGYDEARDGELRRVLLSNTAPFNLVGAPAITVPAGVGAAGLPVGLQLVAPWWEEARLLRAAAAWERDHPPQLPAIEGEDGRNPRLD
ncbi:MAG: amidase [Firmicutes bacterium]|nr:amidase [Bacillota bacterium]